MEQDSSGLGRALENLRRYGVLLESDPLLPSVVSLVAGEPIRGSWWSHPRGEAIFRVTRQLADHPDVLVTKLISGKVTYVHRRLWPALLAAGTAQDAWQRRSLSLEARSVLDMLSRTGELRTADIPWTGGNKKSAPGETARELERRLLVHSEEVHTSTGAHGKRLETWELWAKRAGFVGEKTTPERAKEELEQALEGLNRRFGANGRLPWNMASR